jgi:hypothetical protein
LTLKNALTASTFASANTHSSAPRGQRSNPNSLASWATVLDDWEGSWGPWVSDDAGDGGTVAA